MSEHAILSFDCARRTLAYTYAIVKPIDLECWLNEFLLLSSRDHIDPVEAAERIFALAQACKNYINVKRYGVINIADGLDLNDAVYNARALKNVLNTLPVDVTPDLTVIIEDQPDVMKSYGIQCQLMLYYSDCNVILISPHEKNKINLDPTIHMNVFLQHCRDQYSANKMHSSANFLKWIRDFELERMLTAVDSKFDDLADSFMQLLAYATRLK